MHLLKHYPYSTYYLLQLKKKKKTHSFGNIAKKFPSKISVDYVFSLFINSFIYLFFTALGPHYCTRAFFSCSEWELLFIVVHTLLIVVASLVAEHGL